MIGLWRHKWPSVFLWPFSCIFGIAVHLRNRLYEKGTLRTVSLDAKVISVGNITVGGTGKTPLVEAITRSLSQSGLKPAIVSRGYGRKTKEVVMVSDGKCITEDTGKTGDEPLLLARRLPGIPVGVGDRILAGQAALSRGGVEGLGVGGGFQHRE